MRSVLHGGTLMRTRVLLSGLIASCLLIVSSTVGSASISGREVLKADGSNAVELKVVGPIAGLVSSPLAMSPAFTPEDTNYVWRCAAGTNVIHLRFDAADRRGLTSDGHHGSSV